MRETLCGGGWLLLSMVQSWQAGLRLLPQSHTGWVFDNILGRAGISTLGISSLKSEIVRISSFGMIYRVVIWYCKTDAFSKLYRLARDKNALVATHMQVRLDSAHWSLDFIRDVQDWDLESITSFLDLLYSTKVRGSGEDPMCWLPSPQKGFKVSSFYRVLSSSFPGWRLFLSVEKHLEA